MAKRATINSRALAKTVADALQQYGDDVAEAVAKEVPIVAAEAAEEINRNAAGHNWTASRYDRSWDILKKTQKRNGITYIVHSDMPWLPHLLEWGHAKANGGRTRDFPHVSDAEKNAVTELEKRITEAVQNAG